MAYWEYDMANIYEMAAIADRLNQMLDAVNATGVKFYYSDFDNCMRSFSDFLPLIII